MKSETQAHNIEELLREIDEAVEWFHGDDFSLDEARSRYEHVHQLAKQADARLMEMKNEVEMLP